MGSNSSFDGVDCDGGVGSMEAESTATTGSPSTACKHVINDHINFYQSQDKTLIAETNDGIKG